MILRCGTAEYFCMCGWITRETAARELDERRADWGYSKPVVALDMSWNMAFVVVSAVILACTVDEQPNTPIRVWIIGYALQCFVHVVMVWLEYRCRSRRDSWRRPRESDTESSADGNDNNDGDRNSFRSGKDGVWVGHLLSGYSLPMEDPNQSKGEANVEIRGTWTESIKAAYEATRSAFPGGEILAHLDQKSFNSWQKNATSTSTTTSACAYK